MSTTAGFISKIKNSQLQPSEIHLIADLIIIFYCLNGRLPTKVEIQSIWSSYMT